MCSNTCPDELKQRFASLNKWLSARDDGEISVYADAFVRHSAGGWGTEDVVGAAGMEEDFDADGGGILAFGTEKFDGGDVGGGFVV